MIASGMMPESWERVASALRYYSDCGYAYFDAPWMVPKWAVLSTAPPHVELYRGPDGNHIVASGEQSLIAAVVSQSLDVRLGRVVCVTPCFRDEVVYDALRKPGFIKVELYDDENPNNWRHLATDAATLFESWGVGVDIVETGSESADLVARANGIELGSYGRRTYGHREWAYGTGIAEPRFTAVMTRGPDDGT